MISETINEKLSENNVIKSETKKKPRINSTSKSTSKSKETVSLDKDLNLKPQSKKHFRDFYEEKKPSSAIEFNTVAIYYLAEILEVSNINQNHIYTCYKEVSKKAPNAFLQSLRDTASKNGYIDTSNVNDLKIPLRGKNFVEHDLPKKIKVKNV
ncbi:MAG: hypothetical protein CMP76_02390 [Flavobacterium sp.]|uniref:hypothetical protein n=1 Tax=Flavobacterium sp. TaxID=239 RepID=UPI000C5AB6DB|nr:hypothetical protein [Flavobacterium sp.]MBF02124.1 hypothetical protein [Flavobacterium sp.]